MSAPAASSAVSRSSSRPHTALWVMQALLAVTFGMAGFMKLTMPIAELAQQLVWPGDIPSALVRFIGLAEVSAAVGLLLPSLTRIRPWLTPLAAICLAAMMLLATGFHLMRGEVGFVGIPGTLGALAVFVAWGRARKAPIAPRGS